MQQPQWARIQGQGTSPWVRSHGQGMQLPRPRHGVGTLHRLRQTVAKARAAPWYAAKAKACSCQGEGTSPCAHRQGQGKHALNAKDKECKPWPRQCAHGAVLAMVACPWRRALALKAACLSLGCVPMGMPWSWQYACLKYTTDGPPCPWQRAHGNSMAQQHALGCCHGLVCMSWHWLHAHGDSLAQQSDLGY